MTRLDTNPELPREIRRILSAVRWRIRGYVWLQGLSVAVLWLGLTFWFALAVDYLPVLACAGEMPQVGRAVLLVSVAAAAGLDSLPMGASPDFHDSRGSQHGGPAGTVLSVVPG